MKSIACLCWETDLPVAMAMQGVESLTMLMADHGYAVQFADLHRDQRTAWPTAGRSLWRSCRGRCAAGTPTARIPTPPPR